MTHVHIFTEVGAAWAAAVAAFGASGVSLWATQRGRRDQREQRVWERRNETYVDLIAWAIRQRHVARLEPTDLPPTLLDSELVELEARANAYASKKVDSVVDELTPSWRHLALAWGDFKALNEVGSDVNAMRSLFEGGVGQPESRIEKYAAEVDEWSEKLIKLIREEIQSMRSVKTHWWNR